MILNWMISKTSRKVEKADSIGGVSINKLSSLWFQPILKYPVKSERSISVMENSEFAFWIFLISSIRNLMIYRAIHPKKINRTKIPLLCAFWAFSDCELAPNCTSPARAEGAGHSYLTIQILDCYNSRALYNTHMRTMVLLYLPTWLDDFVRANVGAHIPAPWFAYGIWFWFRYLNGYGSSPWTLKDWGPTTWWPPIWPCFENLGMCPVPSFIVRDFVAISGFMDVYSGCSSPANMGHFDSVSTLGHMGHCWILTHWPMPSSRLQLCVTAWPCAIFSGTGDSRREALN